MGLPHQVEDDLRTSCFICDIEPEDFEQFNVRYTDHIKHDHNMWQYVWLKIYLRDKDRTQYSGTEMHVAPYLLRNNARCMPIKKSRAIQGKVKDKATLPTILKKITAMSSATDRALDDLRRRLDKSAEDMHQRISEALERQGGGGGGRPNAAGGQGAASAHLAGEAVGSGAGLLRSNSSMPVDEDRLADRM